MVNHIKAKSICFKDKLRIKKLQLLMLDFQQVLKKWYLVVLLKLKSYFKNLIKDEALVDKVLTRLNINHLINKNIAELSGGQQRVLIASFNLQSFCLSFR